MQLAHFVYCFLELYFTLLLIRSLFFSPTWNNSIYFPLKTFAKLELNTILVISLLGSFWISEAMIRMRLGSYSNISKKWESCSLFSDSFLRIGELSVQSLLSAWSNIWIQPHFESPCDRWMKLKFFFHWDSF